MIPLAVAANMWYFTLKELLFLLAAAVTPGSPNNLHDPAYLPPLPGYCEYFKVLTWINVGLFKQSLIIEIRP